MYVVYGCMRGLKTKCIITLHRDRISLAVSDSAPQSLQHRKSWGPVASLEWDTHFLASRYLRRSRSRLAPRWVQRTEPEQLLLSVHLSRGLVMPAPRLRPQTPTGAASQETLGALPAACLGPPLERGRGSHSPTAFPTELQFPAGWA